MLSKAIHYIGKKIDQFLMVGIDELSNGGYWEFREYMAEARIKQLENTPRSAEQVQVGYVNPEFVKALEPLLEDSL